MFGLFKSSKKKKEPELSEEQKRRNVYESRRSAQETDSGVEHSSAQWEEARNRDSATRYEHSEIGFSGGNVGVSHRVSNLKDPDRYGKGFAQGKSTPHKGKSRTAGFAKDIGEGVGEDNSQADSSSRKPLGF